MRRIHLLPLLALVASSQGAALFDGETFDLESGMDLFQELVTSPDTFLEAFGIRAKRHTEVEDHSGFRTFSLPFGGVDVGVKYLDPSDRVKGGEAFLHIADLKSVISAAHSNLVKVHVKFDGGAASHDGLFNAVVDYHLEHSDGHGTEEGSLKVVREMRGGKWHTNIKTESHPFPEGPDTTIISKRISNMELDIESDRASMLIAKYSNPTMNRDLKVDIRRTKFSILGPNKNVKFEIDVTNKGDKISGSFEAKMEQGKASKILIDLKKGAQPLFKLLTEVKMQGMQGRARGKFSLLGTEQGTFTVKYQNGVLTVESGPHKLSVKLQMGRSINIRAETDGVEMWTYSTLREDKSTGGNTLYEIRTDMNLNPASKLHRAIDMFYPFGAFLSRTNTIRIFADRERNALFRKFKVDFEVVKDGAKVVDLVADTTKSPYEFSFAAPNLFEKIGFSEPKIKVTVNHQRGSSLVIDSNVAGGLHLDINHAPNSIGGRTINVLATKSGVQTIKYVGNTSKTDNADMLKVGLKGRLDLSPESVFHRLIVGRYRLLTSFNSRESDFEFFWDKKNKNFFMNKFYAKGNVNKDGQNVFNMVLSTNQKPYKLHLFLPAILGKLRPGMEEVDVDVMHNPGSSLEMKVNHATTKWSGFKVTRNGQEAEIEWDGKKLAKGDYTLTDNRFQTTQTMANGKSLTTTVTWKNDWDSRSFFLDNKVNLNLDGTERRLNLDMDWGMSKIPDLDLATPEDGFMKIHAEGNNKRWGDYSVSRDIKFSSKRKVLKLELTGNSGFALGPLSAASPIQTQVDASFDVDTTDMVGVFKKVLAGKEYSITFPRGSFVPPTIKLGA